MIRNVVVPRFGVVRKRVTQTGNLCGSVIASGFV